MALKYDPKTNTHVWAVRENSYRCTVCMRGDIWYTCPRCRGLVDNCCFPVSLPTCIACCDEVDHGP